MTDALLHCLQRERGATCAWVASGGTLPAFGTLMAQWRTNTDSQNETAPIRVPYATQT